MQQRHKRQNKLENSPSNQINNQGFRLVSNISVKTTPSKPPTSSDIGISKTIRPKNRNLSPTDINRKIIKKQSKKKS